MSSQINKQKTVKKSKKNNVNKEQSSTSSSINPLVGLNELNKKAHQLFELLRRFVVKDERLLKTIDSIFETQYLKFLGYIPVDYHTRIIQMYDSVAMLVGCIDFNKLSGSLKIIMSFNFDFGFSDFDVQSYLCKLISNKCSNDPSKKQLLLSLVDKSKPLVDCIKYIVNHSEELVDVCQSFADVEDNVF